MNEVERLLGGESEAYGAFRLAVRAGWWTLLIGALMLTYGWLMGLLLITLGVPVGWGKRFGVPCDLDRPSGPHEVGALLPAAYPPLGDAVAQRPEERGAEGIGA